MKEKISIVAMASISSLGSETSEVWANYQVGASFLSHTDFGKFTAYAGMIPSKLNLELEAFQAEHSKYKNLDRTVLLALYVARKAKSNVGWDADFGVNFGSSRGATELFEKYYDDFTKSELGQTATLASPTTTLGNIASWVAQELQAAGPAISHSITCSTAMHSLLNGIAWLRAGMSKNFMVGGAEAANTPFTIAQMRALKIYSRLEGESFPCKALDMSKKENTMVMGEGAVAMCLEKGVPENALAVVEGLGYATEPLKHSISISDDAQCFQKSIQMALEEAGLDTVDAVVMHAPGTVKGDSSELAALHKVFGKELPALTTNKWKIGHTLGTSGMLSMELAILMLEKQTFVKVPFSELSIAPQKIETILVNAVGFGGNAVSVILSNKK